MSQSTATPRPPPDPRTTWSIRPATILDAGDLLEVLEAVASEGRWIGTQAGFDRVARLASMREMYADPAHFIGFAVVAGAAAPEPAACRCGPTTRPAGP